MANPQDYQLRPIKESDLELVLQWRNSERIRANMYTDHIISFDEHKRWFLNTRTSESVSYCICEYNHKSIGTVYFTDIDKYNQKSHWGFYLGESNLMMGSGSIMGFMGIDYAFQSLGIIKLCGEVFSFNERAIKLHKKLGFQQEGNFIKHILKKGKYEDVISLALLKNDWLNMRSDLRDLVFRIRE